MSKLTLRRSRGRRLRNGRRRRAWPWSWLWLWCIVAIAAAPSGAHAQGAAPASSISGQVVDQNGGRVVTAAVTLRATAEQTTWTRYTDETGDFSFPGLPAGRYHLSVSKAGFVEVSRELVLGDHDRRDIVVPLQIKGILDAVTIYGTSFDGEAASDGMMRLGDVRDTALLAGKKNDVVVLGQLNASLAIGNTRQVFGKVAGTNIWENDGSGLQIGISNRGLDPNRSWEMNSRQNGYDITADVFGYPEAYFTPPLEAVERIEVVRGSASLQYGAQFGGLVNYVLKRAPPDRRFTFASEQTGGSNGLFNSHNRVGGRIGALSYDGYYQHREGTGWRRNAGFDNDTAFGTIRYDASEKLRVAFELTAMHTLLQMAGGLTDALFQQDARQSVRSRNWFQLRWLLPSLRVDYDIDANTRMSVNVFGLSGRRHSLFNGEPVAAADGTLRVDDPAATRTLYDDRFHNYGAEVRVLRHYQWFGRPNVLATGVRYYHGKTVRQHGVGFPGSGAEFEFFEPDVQRNLHFKNINVAGFAENAFHLTPRLTVTPGVRFDRIDSTGEGRPIVGRQERTRLIPLGGLGATYRLTTATTLYGNISQAYRATLFNDLWRPDPAIIVDPDLKDMVGYVTEFGWRGRGASWLTFDVGGFYLRYGNRLGLLTRATSTGQTLSLWTNVSDSRNIGLESLAEVDLLQLLTGNSERGALFVYSSLAAINTRYLEGSVTGHRVELAPDLIARTGATYRLGAFSTTLQHSHVGDQYSDASNTRFTVDGIQGLIPAYRVWDVSGSYRFLRHAVIRLGVNNLTDARYFTRRATSYPGPGLIPADGRRINVTFGVEY